MKINDIHGEDDGWRRWGTAVALRRLAFAAIVLGAILIPYLLLEDWLLGTGAALLDAMRGRPLQGGLIIIALLAGDVLLPIPSRLISLRRLPCVSDKWEAPPWLIRLIG